MGYFNLVWSQPHAKTLLDKKNTLIYRPVETGPENRWMTIEVKGKSWKQVIEEVGDLAVVAKDLRFDNTEAGEVVCN